MSISKNKKLRIWQRDGFRCTYCNERVFPSFSQQGEKRADYEATLDHIYPKSKGGTDDESNLVTSCNRCNNLLGDKFTSLSAKKKFIKKHLEEEGKKTLTKRERRREDRKSKVLQKEEERRQTINKQERVQKETFQEEVRIWERQQEKFKRDRLKRY